MTTRDERLSTEANIWIAVTRRDGRPHLTPVWFVWVDQKVWLCVQRESVKARIVASRPSVSFALEDGNRPITGEGSASIVEIALAPADVTATFRSKYDWDLLDRSEGSDGAQHILIEITVNRWLQPSDGSTE
jgi:F420H(2)-dependent biliverdin reductase